MPRRHHLQRSVDTLLILALLAVCLLWVRSHMIWDQFDRLHTITHGDQPIFIAYQFRSISGVLMIQRLVALAPPGLGNPPRTEWFRQETSAIKFDWPPNPTFLRRQGFGLDTNASGFASGAAEFTVAAPHWALATVLLLRPAWLARRAHIRRSRARHGRCPDCGYDLRGSTERCPECGHAILGS